MSRADKLVLGRTERIETIEFLPDFSKGIIFQIIIKHFLSESIGLHSVKALAEVFLWLIEPSAESDVRLG